MTESATRCWSVSQDARVDKPYSFPRAHAGVVERQVADLFGELVSGTFRLTSSSTKSR